MKIRTANRICFQVVDVVYMCFFNGATWAETFAAKFAEVTYQTFTFTAVAIFSLSTLSMQIFSADILRRYSPRKQLLLWSYLYQYTTSIYYLNDVSVLSGPNIGVRHSIINILGVILVYQVITSVAEGMLVATLFTTLIFSLTLLFSESEGTVSTTKNWKYLELSGMKKLPKYIGGWAWAFTGDVNDNNVVDINNGISSYLF